MTAGPHPSRSNGDGRDGRSGGELRELLSGLREDTLTPPQERRLEQLLRESDDALDAYVRSVAMQADLYGCLVRWAKRDGLDRTDAGAEPDRTMREPLLLMPTVDPEPEAELQDTLYGQSVFDDALLPRADDEDEPLTVPTWPAVAPTTRGKLGMRARAWLGIVLTAAAVVVFAVGAWWWPEGEASKPARVVAAMTRPTTAPAIEAPITSTATPTTTPAPPPTTTPTPALPSPPPVVATFTASVDGAWDDAIASGALLRAGRNLRLTRGFARLSFPTGAQVVIEAPAQLTLESAARLTLARGRLTANVPDAARGFTVATRRMEVVDLGTEFGVNVAADDSVDVPVFVGHVQARPGVGSGGNAAGDANAAAVVDVRAGQAGRADAAGGVQVAPAGPEAAAFVRDIRNIRMAVPVRGTGEGLKIGEADPRWRIVSLSTDANWKPRDGVVCGPGPRGVDNDDRSAWLSINGERAPVAGGKYAFVTTFDLSRFEPATARLRVRLAVDDFIREVRLNDRVTEIKLALPGTEAKRRLHDFDITEGFVAGENRLEVVVESSYGPANPMALRAELSGTAVRKLDGAR